ncbi:hypothetical protein D1823_02335 [Ruegeria sp. AD91A]|uniref:hypothetical protein n=1 Tax=Ruegeria sp. AD91A TaxID=2293862 RepID=UPI000E4D1664|nr:hypothetical protein [Ruegeria sp. AD91A]AXT25536.1 hypothetical protein D1823_02335 [Ruegeria sp. AD91A]
MAKRRKQRSDSEDQLKRDARAPDLSAATAPRDVPGADLLGDRGRAYYDQFYRTRHEWAIADLALIVIASQALERIWYLQVELNMQPTMYHHPQSGMPRANPGYALLGELRRTVQSALRDAGVRQRDGHTDSDANNPKPAQYQTTTATTAGTGSFDDWMGDHGLH